MDPATAKLLRVLLVAVARQEKHDSANALAPIYIDAKTADGRQFDSVF